MKNHNTVIQYLLLIIYLTGFAALSGCATTVATPGDPWEGMNRGTQSFNDGMDDYLLKPAAKGYNWIMPSFASTGVSNFFSNIRDIKVTINDLLQFKFKQGGMDTARFVVNTTAGIAGFIDVASMISLPKHDEDFGQTLGYWGVPSGPYLVLPFWGPSSVRGTTGRVGDAAMNPLTYTFLFSDSVAVSLGSAALYAIDVVDRRAGVLGFSETIDEAAGEDRYEFIRNAYLQRREYLTNDCDIPGIEIGCELDDDLELDQEYMEDDESDIE